MNPPPNTSLEKKRERETCMKNLNNLDPAFPKVKQECRRQWDSGFTRTCSTKKSFSTYTNWEAKKRLNLGTLCPQIFKAVTVQLLRSAWVTTTHWHLNKRRSLPMGLGNASSLGCLERRKWLPQLGIAGWSPTYHLSSITPKKGTTGKVGAFALNNLGLKYKHSIPIKK